MQTTITKIIFKCFPNFGTYIRDYLTLGLLKVVLTHLGYSVHYRNLYLP